MPPKGKASGGREKSSAPGRKMASGSPDPVHLLLYGFNQFASAIQDVSRCYTGYLTEHLSSKDHAHFIEAINSRHTLLIVFIDITTDYFCTQLLSDDWKTLVTSFQTRLNETLLQIATEHPDLQVR